MLKIRKETLLFTLEIIAISSFFAYKIAHAQLDAKLSLAFTFFLFFSAGLGGILYFLLKFYSQKMALWLDANAQEVMCFTIISFSPFLLLVLVFIQEFVFLNDISHIVLIVSTLGFIYLHLFFLYRLKGQQPEIFPKLSRANIALLCFAFAGIVYILAASGILFAPYPITGDEPHYLLITKSLISDRDVNLLNNYQNKDYLEFYPGLLDSHTKTGRRGSQFQYSRHMPGFSALLLPAYVVGARISKASASVLSKPMSERGVLILAIRLFLCLFAAALSGMFYLVIETLLKNRKISFVVWGLFSFSTPLLFYSYQIYPEVVVALISISLLYLLIIKSNWNLYRSVLAGIGIGILPWLGIKYMIISFGCGLLFFFSFFKQKKKWKNYFYLALPIFLSAVGFLFFLWSLYGKLSPMVVYKGTTVDGSVTFNAFYHHNPFEFLRCWIGYLFDQRVGLFAYSPIFMLFLPGLILWFRKNKKEALSLLVPMTLYWAFCSLSYYWGGYSPPGRTLLPVLWIVCVFTGGAIYLSGKKKPLISIHLLVGLTFLNTFILAKDTRFLYHENLSFPWAEPGKVSNLLNSLSNAFIDFTRFVPSLSSQEGITLVPLFFWILLSFLIGFFFIRRERKSNGRISYQKIMVPMGSLFLVCAAVVLYSFLDIHLDEQKSFQSKDVHVYFQDENTYGHEMSGFWTKGASKVEIIVKSPRKASSINLRLTCPSRGKTMVQVGNAIRILGKKNDGESEMMISFPKPVGFAWEGNHLYAIKIRGESGFVPRKRDERSTDSRFLGVFVEVAVN
jgi:hypothetical protein